MCNIIECQTTNLWLEIDEGLAVRDHALVISPVGPALGAVRVPGGDEMVLEVHP